MRISEEDMAAILEDLQIIKEEGGEINLLEVGRVLGAYNLNSKANIIRVMKKWEEGKKR